MEESKAPTQEEIAELEAAAKSFWKEYGELVEKYQVDIVSEPLFLPDGKGGFRVVTRPTLVSTKNQPTKSPFVAND